MKLAYALALLALCSALSPPCNATALPATPAASAARILDDFERIDAWSALASDDVTASLRQTVGVNGKALCLAYDFNGVSGYAVARRKLSMTYPENYEFLLGLRGVAPANNLEIKLADVSGENVWWFTRPNYMPPQAWTPLRVKKRQIAFAWGPTTDKTLRHSDAFEITISAGKGGGRGELCFDDLGFRELPAADGAVAQPLAQASASLPSHGSQNAVDGSPASAWRAPRGKQALAVDLGALREFGGVTVRWSDDEHASRYRVEASDDGRSWRELRVVSAGNGGDDPIALPETEARWLRLALEHGPGAAYGVQDLLIEPLAFAATPNDFFAALAQKAPRGRFPRGFSGEQPYWTLVGVDGGSEQGLLGEDGALEVAKGGFTIEPFLLIGDRLLDWAQLQSSQSLLDGYLPIPSVALQHAQVALQVTAFAQGSPARSQLVGRYLLHNPTGVARQVTLALAIRPFQVNPPSQLLNTVGGVSAIRTLAIERGVVRVDGKPRVFASQQPDVAFATTFDAGMVETHLATQNFPTSARVTDDTGFASGAMLFRMHLQAGETREISLRIPLSGALDTPGEFDAAAAQESVATHWRESLGRVAITVPETAQPIVSTLRSALAQMLLSRAGPRLQPGTRSYARAWIRDGAMISESLLRLGHSDVAEQFLRWYAPFQFQTGKVPCCVDDRGSDPVPENDSHGELIFTVAELYRYAGDRALLASMWPHVRAAVDYMDTLRLSERTEANRQRNAAFYGLMPASISHEGYSAKPMHSYWDNFWALRGYKDAVDIATWLGHDADARRFALSRDQFRADVYASVLEATRQHAIDFIPGAAELGDFDATSTTIALAPGGEQGRLPETLLRNTFERYWREFRDRRDGRRDWQHYTPYELRNVGAFVRLGWRERAHEALDFFLGDRQPAGWNQWAEVVAREPRKPFFLGDLPHAWVASDYARSALDLFAYTRDSDQTLVIAAGVPDSWLQGRGVAVAGLRTPYGLLAYSLRRTGAGVLLQIDGGLTLPAGGVVLSLPANPRGTLINGKPATWKGGELRIREVPATVVVAP